MQFGMSRRAFAAGAALLPVACSRAGRALPAAATGGSAPPLPALSNPLVKQRADAQIFRHEAGNYYMTGSVPEYDRLILRRSRTLAGLADADERVLWRPEGSGPRSEGRRGGRECGSTVS